MAADGQLLKYDADSYELLAAAEVTGVRQLAEHDGMIYVTRGDVDEFGMNLPLDAYLQWFHADDLTWAGELTTANGPAYATEGLAWSGDRLYIAVNNAFDWGNEVGYIGEWDATTDAYTEFDLGEEGKNPNRLFADNGQIITVNNRDYGSASLSEVMTGTGTVQTHAVADATAGCLAAAVFQGELKYQITGENAVRTSALDGLDESSTWLADAPAFYGAAIDPVSGHWYGSVTDYTTYGLVEIRDEEGSIVSTFDCGVSPGVICMDVRNASDVFAIPGCESARTGEFDLLGRELLPSFLRGVTDGSLTQTVVIRVSSRGRLVILDISFSSIMLWLAGLHSNNEPGKVKQPPSQRQFLPCRDGGHLISSQLNVHGQEREGRKTAAPMVGEPT